jgi:enamine deaminase RidA (YjgF/YER057c/UK114 family)
MLQRLFGCAFALPLLLAACATQVVHYPGDNPALPYSKAVKVGSTLYVAGHLGLDPDTGLAPADPAVEAGLMLNAFAETMARANASLDDLAQVQVYCSDVALYDTFNAIYRERFSDAFPARAFIGSGTLLRGAHFEMVGIAVCR